MRDSKTKLVRNISDWKRRNIDHIKDLNLQDDIFQNLSFPRNNSSLSKSQQQTIYKTVFNFYENYKIKVERRGL